MLSVASTMSRTQVQLWYNRFKEGRADVNDDACPGRPSTLTTDENIKAVKKKNVHNRRITIREVTDDIGISFRSCQAIFTNILGMKRAAAKIVPELLDFKQKQCCIDIAQEMLTQFNDDPDLVVANHGCMTMTLKSKPNHPNDDALPEEPRPKKAHQVWSTAVMH